MPAPAGPDPRVRRIVSGRGEDGGATPLPLRLNVYTSTDPLAPYTVLREASPATWAGLSRTARLDAFPSPSAGPAPGPQASTLAEPTLFSASLPVRDLVRPKIPAAATADLRRRLWPLVSAANADPEEVARVIWDELMGRWAAQNRTLLARSVQIRLLPPDEVPQAPFTLGTKPEEIPPLAVLSFSIDGVPLETADGALPLLALDLLGSNNLEAVGKEVAQKALVIATAGDLLVSTSALLDSERIFWAEVHDEPDSFAAKDVEQHFGLFGIQLSQDGPVRLPLLLQVRFFLRDHPEYAAELAGAAGQLDQLAAKVWAEYPSYRERLEARLHDPEMMTLREGLDRTWNTAAEQWQDQGQVPGAVVYGAAGLTEGLYWVMNMGSFGYLDARHAGVQAFKQGEISYKKLEDLTDAAAARGAAVGVVNLALTAVTAGLAGPVLGTSATLFERMVVAGASNALVNMAAETAGGAITDAVQFQDPAQQAIWSQGHRTVEQIAVSGAAGFALGAAGVPAHLALGKLAAWFRGAPKPLVETGAIVPAGGTRRAPAPIAAAPPGWTAQQVTEDIVRLTHPDVPGEVIVSPTQLRYQIPSGTGMKVELELPRASQGEALARLGSRKPLPLGRAAAPALPAGKTRTPALPAPGARKALPAGAALALRKIEPLHLELPEPAPPRAAFIESSLPSRATIQPWEDPSARLEFRKLLPAGEPVPAEPAGTAALPAEMLTIREAEPMPVKFVPPEPEIAPGSAGKKAARGAKAQARQREADRVLRQLESHRETRLTIYDEIVENTRQRTQGLSLEARQELAADNASNQAQLVNLRKEVAKLLERLKKLRLDPYYWARGFSYSEAAGRAVHLRARGLDEMSGRKALRPQVDHVVSVREIVDMEGWELLAEADQREVLSRLDNLRLMESGLNSSKGSRRWADWSEGKRFYGEAMYEKMVQAEARLRVEIQADIRVRAARGHR